MMMTVNDIPNFCIGEPPDGMTYVATKYATSPPTLSASVWGGPLNTSVVKLHTVSDLHYECNEGDIMTFIGRGHTKTLAGY